MDHLDDLARDRPDGHRPDGDLRGETLRHRITAWLAPTPAELGGLAVLLLGAAVASALLWQQATTRPDLAEVRAVGAPVVGTDDQAPLTGAEVADAALAPPGDVEVAAEPVTVDVTVTVHVTGAVAEAGVVTLPAGARVADAVAAAGGASPDAALERVNLARVLDDGEHVHLPRPDEQLPEPVDGGTAVGGGTLPDGRLDLNRALQEELETLPGIGPAKASAIVEHREANGPFAEPGDLREVPGIGEATFQRLADRVVVR